MLTDPAVSGALDFERPIALIQAGTLHHLKDREHPARIQRAYTAALPPGSFVLFSSFQDPADTSESAHLARALERRFQHGLGTARFRTRAEILEMLEGLEFLSASSAPATSGLVPVREWWPLGPRISPAEPMDRLFVAALGRKPAS